METFDTIVVGAGIAGASLAAHLAETGKVIIVEMEERAGYHTTGRSAAAYEPNYGPPVIRALTRAAWEFYDRPPAGFTDAPLLTRRESLFLVPEGQGLAEKKLLADSQGLAPISLREAQTL